MLLLSNSSSALISVCPGTVRVDACDAYCILTIVMVVKLLSGLGSLEAVGFEWSFTYTCIISEAGLRNRLSSNRLLGM